MQTSHIIWKSQSILCRIQLLFLKDEDLSEVQCNNLLPCADDLNRYGLATVIFWLIESISVSSSAARGV